MSWCAAVDRKHGGMQKTVQALLWRRAVLLFWDCQLGRMIGAGWGLRGVGPGESSCERRVECGRLFCC